jgi:hypothetical protein
MLRLIHSPLDTLGTDKGRDRDALQGAPGFSFGLARD